jgi:short-subunit dehydrogenase
VRIEGRSALVTGATGGLGEAIARALAARGAQLVLSGRRTDVLEPLAAKLGGRALAWDLADRAALEPALAEAGRVDILVANAALPADGRVTEYEVEQVDRALDVNLRAPILTARALAPEMAARGEGHLVFISSLSGKTATAGSSLYSATKYGLRGFALGLREDLWGSGVGVSTIFPGFIRDAGMFAASEVTLPRGVGTRSPGDVASAVVSAIERDRAEIDVAPLGLRLGAALASLAPQASARMTRRMGGTKLAEQIAGSEAHRSRR